MNFSNLSLLIVILLTALMIYWLIKRTFNQANTIQKLEQDIAQLTAKQLEREMAFQRQLDIGIKEAKKRSNNMQRNVLKGQIGEPFIADFPYNPADCRFMGEPIDYVIFHNLHACSEGSVPIEDVKVIFAEIKTGKAKLNPRQKILRQVIENKQFSFEELRIKTDDGQNPAVHNI